MAEFSQISENNSDYPKQYKATDNYESSGYVAPYKVQAGNTRGDQRIKGTITVVDQDNTVRLVLGYKEGAF